jgi:transketolase
MSFIGPTAKLKKSVIIASRKQAKAQIANYNKQKDEALRELGAYVLSENVNEEYKARLINHISEIDERIEAARAKLNEANRNLAS